MALQSLYQLPLAQACWLSLEKPTNRDHSSVMHSLVHLLLN